MEVSLLKIGYSCLTLPTRCFTIIAFIWSPGLCCHPRAGVLPLAHCLTNLTSRNLLFLYSAQVMSLLVWFCCCAEVFISFINSVKASFLNSNKHNKHLSFYQLSSVTGVCAHSVTGFTLGKSDFQPLHLFCALLISVDQGRGRELSLSYKQKWKKNQSVELAVWENFIRSKVHSSPAETSLHGQGVSVKKPEDYHIVTPWLHLRGEAEVQEESKAFCLFRFLWKDHGYCT